MKKSRFTEAQIVGILKEVEMGAKVAETCRKHGVSEPTYYKWKSQFSGMTVSHLAQLRQLQDENAKLKRMYADLARIFHRSRATNEYGIALVCPKIQVSNLDQRAGNAEAKLYRRN